VRLRAVRFAATVYRMTNLINRVLLCFHTLRRTLRGRSCDELAVKCWVNVDSATSATLRVDGGLWYVSSADHAALFSCGLSVCCGARCDRASPLGVFCFLWFTGSFIGACRNGADRWVRTSIVCYVRSPPPACRARGSYPLCLPAAIAITACSRAPA